MVFDIFSHKTDTMKKCFLFLIMIITFNSCATYKVKNLNQNIEKVEYKNVEFVNDIDVFTTKKKVGDFNITDLKKEWVDIKPELLKLAKDNYANAIVVEKFELLGKGVKGKLYQVNISELETIKRSKKVRKLYVFRDELGSILTTHFKTELTLNNITDKLEDRTFKVIDLNENQNIITIGINGKRKDLELTDGTNYFWISRQVNANQYGGTGLNVEIGGQKILKLKDNEMGEIWISTLK